MYVTPEQLQEKINEYFKKGIALRKVIVGPANNREVVEIPVPTITGLALYCGFSDRVSFYDYEKREEFSYTIKKARATMEQHYEELIQGSTPTGAIFALKNFGWIDTQKIEGLTPHYHFTNIQVGSLETKSQEDLIDCFRKTISKDPEREFDIPVSGR